MRSLLAVLFLTLGTAVYADETQSQEVVASEEGKIKVETESLSTDFRLFHQGKGGCGCGGKPKS